MKTFIVPSLWVLFLFRGKHEANCDMDGTVFRHKNTFKVNNARYLLLVICDAAEPMSGLLC